MKGFLTTVIVYEIIMMVYHLNGKKTAEIMTTLLHKVNTQYVQFKSRAEYFLLPWKIHEKKYTINALP